MATTSDDNSVDQTKDYLEELVGEGKKFKTAADLARGKYEADQFIERLKREQDELRAELSRRLPTEDILTKVEQLMNSRNPDNGNSGAPNRNDHENGDTGGLTPEKIAELVEQRLTQRETQKTVSENLAAVKQALQTSFGDNYQQELLRKASELGYTPDEFTNLAKSKPKAFLALVGANSTPSKGGDPFSAPPRSSVNTLGTQNSGDTGVRTKAYYDKIKKDNPTTYWSVQVQNQMHKDAVRLGAKFFETK